MTAGLRTMARSALVVAWALCASTALAETHYYAGVYFCGPAGARGAETATYQSVPELNHPYVSGVSYRQFWRNIEPARGEFDWRSLENAHRQAEALGKGIMITVTAGMGTPDWIYAQGARSVQFHADEAQWWTGSDEALRMPVPWDATYLAAWDAFVGALGRKIRDWDNVYCVHMTGGGYISEMHLPKGRAETVRQWRDAGFNEETCTATWQRIIRSYDMHIPAGIGLSLALSPVLEQEHCSDSIFDWASKRYPGRVWFQRNILKERTSGIPDGPFSAQLRRAASYTTVGWQMAQVAGRDVVGDRPAAYGHALNTGSSFVEVYGVDINNPELAGALTMLNDGLRANAERGGAGEDGPLPAAVQAAAAAATVPGPQPARGAAPRGRENRAGRGPARPRGRTFEDTVWVKDASRLSLPAGCRYETFASPSMGHDVGYVIYLPPQYEQSEAPLPVIYFLHGIGGDEVGASRNARYASEAIRAGAIRPSVVVFVNGAYSAFYSDSADGKYNVETSIVKELIPHIESKYRVIAGREGRLVEGFSMGGHGALKLALKYPEMFCSAVSYAGALMELRGFKQMQPREFLAIFGGLDELYQQNSPWELLVRNEDRIRASGLRICIIVGTEDGTMRNGERFHKLLTEHSIDHVYKVAEGARHRLTDYMDIVGSFGYRFHEESLEAAEPADAEAGMKSHPGHYAAVGPGAAMEEIPHLDEPAVRGVNKRYKWKRLEPRKGEYDFSEIEQDLKVLAQHDKQLVVFLIDKSFSEWPSLPDYLSAYAVEEDGWLDPVRWHPVMVERMIALGRALAERFDDDPHFEGVALQESALDMTDEAFETWGYSPEKYRDALIAMLTGIQKSFERSHVFWYCNFMHGDDGHLRQVAEAIVPYGVFMGGPDILPYRIGLKELNYPMYDEFEGRLTLFCSAQHDSYCHHRNDTRVWRKEPVPEEGYLTMEQIFLFARDSLHVSYIFWDVKYGGEDEGERDYDDAIEVMREYPTFNEPTAGQTPRLPGGQ